MAIHPPLLHQQQQPLPKASIARAGVYPSFLKRVPAPKGGWAPSDRQMGMNKRRMSDAQREDIRRIADAILDPDANGSGPSDPRLVTTSSLIPNTHYKLTLRPSNPSDNLHGPFPPAHPSHAHIHDPPILEVTDVADPFDRYTFSCTSNALAAVASHAGWDAEEDDIEFDDDGRENRKGFGRKVAHDKRDGTGIPDEEENDEYKSLFAKFAKVLKSLLRKCEDEPKQYSITVSHTPATAPAASTIILRVYKQLPVSSAAERQSISGRDAPPSRKTKPRLMLHLVLQKSDWENTKRDMWGEIVRLRKHNDALTLRLLQTTEYLCKHKPSLLPTSLAKALLHPRYDSPFKGLAGAHGIGSDGTDSDREVIEAQPLKLNIIYPPAPAPIPHNTPVQPHMPASEPAPLPNTLPPDAHHHHFCRRHHCCRHLCDNKHAHKHYASDVSAASSHQHQSHQRTRRHHESKSCSRCIRRAQRAGIDITSPAFHHQSHPTVAPPIAHNPHMYAPPAPPHQPSSHMEKETFIATLHRHTRLLHDSTRGARRVGYYTLTLAHSTRPFEHFTSGRITEAGWVRTMLGGQAGADAGEYEDVEDWESGGGQASEGVKDVLFGEYIKKCDSEPGVYRAVWTAHPAAARDMFTANMDPTQCRSTHRHPRHKHSHNHKQWCIYHDTTAPPGPNVAATATAPISYATSPADSSTCTLTLQTRDPPDKRWHTVVALPFHPTSNATVMHELRATYFALTEEVEEKAGRLRGVVEGCVCSEPGIVRGLGEWVSVIGRGHGHKEDGAHGVEKRDRRPLSEIGGGGRMFVNQASRPPDVFWRDLDPSTILSRRKEQDSPRHQPVASAQTLQPPPPKATHAVPPLPHRRPRQQAVDTSKNLAHSTIAQAPPSTQTDTHACSRPGRHARRDRNHIQRMQSRSRSRNPSPSKSKRRAAAEQKAKTLGELQRALDLLNERAERVKVVAREAHHGGEVEDARSERVAVRDEDDMAYDRTGHESADAYASASERSRTTSERLRDYLATVPPPRAFLRPRRELSGGSDGDSDDEKESERGWPRNWRPQRDARMAW
ncbi:uncharacterized protein EV422DRAFT_527170 [Fimicolochytrium jonesii]|uniref:uncharacterized protein n=1 Tax=Fimicolochytrium jonesii TaxID=1396493 RepID=UPI0022FF1039|nr:uncharacterized protein EV422DRAFT_527170 [Fimicolochytrium jonesii]KAI8821829.1 hypothetical protein EV422DRAFT_527170 [Fimicolochytrium jonesii]